MKDEQKKPSGYDKFINWKLFSIPLAALLILLFIPTPHSMLDGGVASSRGSMIRTREAMTALGPIKAFCELMQAAAQQKQLMHRVASR